MATQETKGVQLIAYFPNSSAADVLTDQCSRCMFGEGPCPIAWVQLNYNYQACNDKLGRAILNDLVDEKEGCRLFVAFREKVETESPDQSKMF